MVGIASSHCDKSVTVSTERDNGGSTNMSSKYFVAVETRYTILVSTVTVRVTLIPPSANELQQPVARLHSDNGLTKESSVGRISEATAAAERY